MGHAGGSAAGTAGIWLQTAALWAGVAPSLALAAGWPVPAAVTTYALVGALVVSRFGLWTFDLAVSQLLQERVPDAELGEQTFPPLRHAGRVCLSSTAWLILAYLLPCRNTAFHLCSHDGVPVVWLRRIAASSLSRDLGILSHPVQQ